LDANDFNRPSYLDQESIRPLTHFTKLQELRIFGMRDSFQGVIWETVFRNDADFEGKSMRVLDLTMASPPIVRHEGWIQGKNVVGLSVAEEDETPYR
jgi:hypothetical protein